LNFYKLEAKQISNSGLIMKILVVDDSRLARASIIKTLKESLEEDQDIIQGVNGEEAISFYKEHSPAVVFLDLTMPVMDGFEALRQIKSINNKANVVIVSADIQEKAVSQVMHDGAIMHVQKPINTAKMQEIIKTVNFLNKAATHHGK